jgi:hypothetical protein
MLQAKPFLIKKAWPGENIAPGQVVMVRPVSRVSEGQLIAIRYKGKPHICRLVRRFKGGVIVRGRSGREIKIKRDECEIVGKVLRGNYQMATISLVSRFITHNGRLRMTT